MDDIKCRKARAKELVYKVDRKKKNTDENWTIIDAFIHDFCSKRVLDVKELSLSCVLLFEVRQHFKFHKTIIAKSSRDNT